MIILSDKNLCHLKTIKKETRIIITIAIIINNIVIFQFVPKTMGIGPSKIIPPPFASLVKNPTAKKMIPKIK